MRGDGMTQGTTEQDSAGATATAATIASEPLPFVAPCRVVATRAPLHWLALG